MGDFNLTSVLQRRKHALIWFWHSAKRMHNRSMMGAPILLSALEELKENVLNLKHIKFSRQQELKNLATQLLHGTFSFDGMIN